MSTDIKKYTWYRYADSGSIEINFKKIITIHGFNLQTYAQKNVGI